VEVVEGSFLDTIRALLEQTYYMLLEAQLEQRPSMVVAVLLRTSRAVDFQVSSSAMLVDLFNQTQSQSQGVEVLEFFSQAVMLEVDGVDIQLAAL
jgi:hypothetical protein